MFASAGALTALAVVFLLRHRLPIQLEGSPLPLPRCAADFMIGLLLYRCQGRLVIPAWLGSTLSIEPLHFLGRISYSIYLTHWPILWAFGVTWQAAALLVVVPVLSYRYIERPAREFGRRSKAKSPASLRPTQA